MTSLRVCDNCKHKDKKATEEPYKECLTENKQDMWVPTSDTVVMKDGT